MDGLIVRQEDGHYGWTIGGIADYAPVRCAHPSFYNCSKDTTRNSLNQNHCYVYLAEFRPPGTNHLYTMTYLRFLSPRQEVHCDLSVPQNR
jgi:hypothetical protein